MSRTRSSGSIGVGFGLMKGKGGELVSTVPGFSTFSTPKLGKTTRNIYMLINIICKHIAFPKDFHILHLFLLTPNIPDALNSTMSPFCQLTVFTCSHAQLTVSGFFSNVQLTGSTCSHDPLTICSHATLTTGSNVHDLQSSFIP